jgi:hypothetical protein
LRLLAISTIVAVLVPTLSGCDSIKGVLPGGESQGEVTVTSTDHGPCLPIYGDEVLSASMSRDGSRLLFISGERPAGMDDDSWNRDDRALYLLTFAEDGSPATNVLATTWPPPPGNTIPPAATPDEEGDLPQPGELEEQMVDVRLAGNGERFIISVQRQASTGLAKIYTGIVPEGDAAMAPGEGLDLVSVNDYLADEFVQSYYLTDDGNRLAVVIAGGELRTFDFGTDTLNVYDVGDDGQTIVSHELPPAQISIEQTRQPAVTSSGTMRLTWAPDGRRLAFARPESVGTAGVWILDTDTGETTFVRGYRNTTVPWVTWSKDGESLFILSSIYDTAQTFGNSEVRRVEAKANGADIGDRWQLRQDPYFRSAPSDFVAYGDDQNFVFLWENQVWLLQVPPSGSGAASYGAVTPKAPTNLSSWKDGTMAVKQGSISISPDRDIAAFVVVDPSGQHVAMRLYVTEEQCPLGAVEPAADEQQPPEQSTGQQDTGGQDTGSQDAAGQDTGGQDTGSQETGGQDTGGQDTGSQDAGGQDTGGQDTGSQETGGQDTSGQQSGTDEG